MKMDFWSVSLLLSFFFIFPINPLSLLLSLSFSFSFLCLPLSPSTFPPSLPPSLFEAFDFATDRITAEPVGYCIFSRTIPE